MINKFRAWDKMYLTLSNVESITGLEKEDSDELKYICTDDLGKEVKDWKNIILMQSTGFFDKNQIEIFEGDILKCYFDKDKIANWLYASFSKEILEKGFLLHAVILPDFYQNPLPDEIEVIGNIHENPELLLENNLKGNE